MTFAGMLYTSRAIVLRTVKYGETSLIADLFTEQKGLQTFIFNSVRKSKASTPPAYLQILSLVEIVAYFKEQQQIHRTREIRLDHAWSSIPFDMRKSAVITCLAEICSKCIKTADPHPELFMFMHDALIEYDNPNAYDRDFLLRFLITLSQHLGFGMEIKSSLPAGHFFDLKEGHTMASQPAHPYFIGKKDLEDLQKIMASDIHKKADVPLETRQRLVDHLVTYYKLHVESLGEIRSISVFRELQI